ncbi:exodeoxyribonuclease VII small subunit [Thomasclavelia spiroformis]|uniref:exodeoxyribonuclease VII small subunit n=1 Tax=Thomasclavelia spiroformis TaxID=29348 RepID=UPI00241BFFB6|nr:exodeoxyribonuclease VII small subunit [Thomasclavelia spiroformis]MBS6114070.1 exodeoxyribonuclease VII small subunit [Thomasclavelia spiroformis]
MENITFEQAMNRLEEIVSALENNQISLEKSVELFQEGIQLTKLCNDKLEGIENKVVKILVDGKLEDLNLEE